MVQEPSLDKTTPPLFLTEEAKVSFLAQLTTPIQQEIALMRTNPELWVLREDSFIRRDDIPLNFDRIKTEASIDHLKDSDHQIMLSLVHPEPGPEIGKGSIEYRGTVEGFMNGSFSIHVNDATLAVSVNLKNNTVELIDPYTGALPLTEEDKRVLEELIDPQVGIISGEGQTEGRRTRIALQKFSEAMERSSLLTQPQESLKQHQLDKRHIVPQRLMMESEFLNMEEMLQIIHRDFTQKDKPYYIGPVGTDMRRPMMVNFHDGRIIISTFISQVGIKDAAAIKEIVLLPVVCRDQSKNPIGYIQTYRNLDRAPDSDTYSVRRIYEINPSPMSFYYDLLHAEDHDPTRA